jgi:hypothetical protein
MATVSLTSALTAQRDIGRSRVFYAVTAPGGSTPLQWDGTTELYLKWLCDTEGDLVMEPNASYNRLTAPELAGDAPLKAYVQGEAPVLTIPAVLANPDLRDILSPTGAASGGFSAQRPVSELTLVVFIEELFMNATTKVHDLTLDPNGGTWLLGGVALTGRKLALFNLTAWLWRCFPRKPGTGFRHGEGGKAIQTVEIELMLDTTKPEGHLLYTIGDPYLASTPIDVEGGS